MHDRVADVLAQREKLENGAGAAIVASLLFHGFLSGLAIWAAWHHGTETIPSVMSIRFAKPTPAAEMAPATAPARPPAPKPEAKPKPEKKTVPFSPFGKSTKKGSEQALRAVPRAPLPAAMPAPAAPAQEVPVGGAGVTALEGGDFPYTIYIDRMKALIGSHWFRPQVTGDISAIVFFSIQRDGSLRDVRIEQPSGDGLFDRAALGAVLQSSPLPPLPFGYSGTYLGVHLKFR